jgi:hypothetical protein
MPTVSTPRGGSEPEIDHIHEFLDDDDDDEDDQDSTAAEGESVFGDVDPTDPVEHTHLTFEVCRVPL